MTGSRFFRQTFIHGSMNYFEWLCGDVLAILNRNKILIPSHMGHRNDNNIQLNKYMSLAFQTQVFPFQHLMGSMTNCYADIR